MTSRYVLTAIGLALIMAPHAGSAGGPQVFAIRNARIVPVSKAPIEKGTVVVRDGLIEAVGATVEPPPDAWVIEGAGLTVYPGLIDGLSTWGLPTALGVPVPATTTRSTVTAVAPVAMTTTPVRPINGPEDRPSNTSYVKAADEIVAGDASIESARDAGFTTAITFPTTNIFAGQGVII